MDLGLERALAAQRDGNATSESAAPSYQRMCLTLTMFTTTFIRKHSLILSNNLQLDRSILWFTDLQMMAAAQARLQTWLGP